MINPFVYLIVEAINLYIWCVIAWTILATLISFKIVNAYQPIVQRLMYALNRLCEPALRPIRRALPDLGGLDISPVVLILLLNFLIRLLVRYFGGL